MSESAFNAVEMVRAIRDQIYEETRGMTRQQFLEYIHREAAAALGEDEDGDAAPRP